MPALTVDTVATAGPVILGGQMSLRRSKSVSVIGLLTSAVLVLSACGGGGGSTGGSADEQNRDPGSAVGSEVFTRPQMPDTGEFTMVREGGFNAYNNGIGANNSFQNTVLLSNVQPSPYFTDRVDGKLVLKVDGDLMESVEVQEEPMVVTYKIRQEAVWSDGEPVSCKDWYLDWFSSVSKITTSGEGGDVSVWDRSSTGYDKISKIECSDNNKTVKATFSEPFADYRSLFYFMMPAHVLERETGIADITKVTDDNAEEVRKAAEFYTKGWIEFDPTRALSAGPYKIEKGTPEESVLVRNDKWWANAGGPSKLTYRVNMDSQSAAQQLQNREVDVVATQADGAVTTQLRNDPSVKVFTASGQTYEHIDLRMNLPLFQDKAVRQAIAACVPRQELVDKLVKDVDPNAKPLGSLAFMPNEQGYEDHWGDTANGDVEAAKKILTDAGYAQGADGIFAKGGQRVSFRLGHRVVTRRADTVRITAAACRPAGIEIIDDQSENFNDERLPAGDFDAALFAWVGSPFKSGSHGNYACKPTGASNYNLYCNPEMDKKYEEANKELDFDKRIELMNEVDQIMREDVHSIPLFVLTDFAASQADIQNISYVGINGGVTWNLFAWRRG
jgi:peptide/nickel transport system substrate-binding protein